jgi:hypothetical protein
LNIARIINFLNTMNLKIINTTDVFNLNLNRAAKWHNLNNRGCKPTAIYEMNVTALKGLNIRLVR